MFFLFLFLSFCFLLSSCILQAGSKEAKEVKQKAKAQAQANVNRAKGVAGIRIEGGVSRMDPRAKRVLLNTRTALGYLIAKFDINGG